MKRLVLMVVLVVVVGCGLQRSEHMIRISASNVVEKVMNHESFLLYIDHDDCDPCDTFFDDFDEVVRKEKLTVYALNYSSIDVDMAEQLSLMNVKFTSWPVLIHVRDGVIMSENIYEYSLDPEGWKQWLISQGILKVD